MTATQPEGLDMTKLTDEQIMNIADSYSFTWDEGIVAFARALLSASKPAAPMQPTEAMLHAARDWSVKKYGQGIGSDAAIGCWQAMLAASHAAPAQSGEPVALDIHERNALNEAVKLLPSISALRTLRAKLLAAPQSSQPVEAGDTAQTWAPVISRNFLGQIVREAWVKWAKQQPNPKPSWLSPYDELDEADKEADRQIGEAVVQWVLSIKSATWEVAPSAVVLDDGRAAFAQAAVRMLEGYAESYDAMARDRDGNGLVACTSVAFDIRRNMAGWFEAHATAAQLAQTTLTDEQRVAIRECIDYLTPAAKQFSDLGIPGMGDSKHARCIRTLRALLTAAQPASGGDHG
jgi:hypothetical protein